MERGPSLSCLTHGSNGTWGSLTVMMEQEGWQLPWRASSAVGTHVLEGPSED